MKQKIPKKVLKEISINGVKVRLELSEEEARNFPKKLVSTVRIRTIPNKTPPSKSQFV